MVKYCQVILANVGPVSSGQNCHSCLDLAKILEWYKAIFVQFRPKIYFGQIFGQVIKQPYFATHFRWNLAKSFWHDLVNTHSCLEIFFSQRGQCFSFAKVAGVILLPDFTK